MGCGRSRGGRSQFRDHDDAQPDEQGAGDKQRDHPHDPPPLAGKLADASQMLRSGEVGASRFHPQVRAQGRCLLIETSCPSGHIKRPQLNSGG